MAPTDDDLERRARRAYEGSRWQWAVVSALPVVLIALLCARVARDPMLSFHFKGGEPGAPLRVHWTDNLGDERSDEVRIA